MPQLYNPFGPYSVAIQVVGAYHRTHSEKTFSFYPYKSDPDMDRLFALWNQASPDWLKNLDSVIRQSGLRVDDVKAAAVELAKKEFNVPKTPAALFGIIAEKAASFSIQRLAKDFQISVASGAQKIAEATPEISTMVIEAGKATAGALRLAPYIALGIGAVYLIMFLRKTTSVAGALKTNPKEKRWKRPSRIQSLHFDINRYTAGEARSWAREHGFKDSSIEEMPSHWTLRQESPAHFDELRTKSLTDGIVAIVGLPRIEHS